MSRKKGNMSLVFELAYGLLMRTTMKINKIKNEEQAAIAVLRQTGVNVVEAALIAKRALEAGRGRVKRAMECITMGTEALRLQEKTVTFERAVLVALEERKSRRKRTQSDFRYIARRFMKRCKGLAKRRMRSITPQECAEYLRQAFHTPRQRNKARLILSGVFSTAVARGWCAKNPICKTKPEKIDEKRIEILSKNETAKLMSTSEEHDGGSCLAAVSIMLLAGVRPHECERLRWSDIRLPASDAEAPCAEATGVIVISPQHSKTGGARSVTIHPPLARILRRVQKADHERICPPNWRRHWAALHREAGFTHWQPDVLRHTFATHHLATFRSYTELQLEMGHRSAELLRTRYVAMEGLCLANYRRGETLLVEYAS